jgi:hypothetical protein
LDQNGAYKYEKNGIKEHVFAYIYWAIVGINRYLVVPFNIVASGQKDVHSYKINKFVTVLSQRFVLSSMILHRGMDYKTGHYLIYILKEISGGKMKYLLYDDAKNPEEHEETLDTDHLNPTNYKQSINTPYTMVYMQYT